MSTIKIKIKPHIKKISNDTALCWFDIIGRMAGMHINIQHWLDDEPDLAKFNLSQIVADEQIYMRSLLRGKGIEHLDIYIRDTGAFDFYPIKATVDVSNEGSLVLNTYKEHKPTDSDLQTVDKFASKRDAKMHALFVAFGMLISSVFTFAICTGLIYFSQFAAPMIRDIVHGNTADWAKLLGSFIAVIVGLCIITICNPFLPNIVYNSWEEELYMPYYGNVIGYSLLILSYPLAQMFHWPNIALYILIVLSGLLAFVYNLRGVFEDLFWN